MLKCICLVETLCTGDHLASDWSLADANFSLFGLWLTDMSWFSRLPVNTWNCQKDKPQPCSCCSRFNTWCSPSHWLLAHQQTRPSFPCWKVESPSNYINGPLSHSQSSPSETLKHNLLIECQEISKRSAILATPRILWTPGMGGEWQGAGWGKVTVIHIFHIILCPK